jgi:cobalt-zinc-cadmium efflux system outer membrane protein
MKIHFLWLTLATSGIMLGCASNNHRTSHRVSAKFVPDATAVAKEPNTPAEQSDQLTVDSSSVLPASGYSTDQTAVSSDVIFAAVEPINSDEGNNASAVMAGEQTSLDELVSLAMANNPAIKELAATTQKAAGFRTQVGLYANPIVGYQGQQLADRGTDQHLIFAEQEFVTADKLNLNRRVQNEALRAQLQELEAQRIRVATDIRTRYYEALGFQKQLELIQEFRKLLDKGYDLAQLRLKAAEGSKIDVLQAKVQRSELDLISRQTQARYDAAWREMAAITGIQNLAPRTLSGSFDNVATSMQWEDIASNLVTTSPEYAAAQARISQAQAELNRHGVQAIPNITAQFGAGVDNGTNSGMMNLQVGAPIPVFNKNQGNIAAARAEYCRAVMEAKRIEQSIRARLAAVSREFESALEASKSYSSDILPSAEEALTLAEAAYKAGEMDFIQVLVARRTYFESNLQYVNAQAQLASAQAKLDGYVLTGSLDAVIDRSGSDALRGLTFSQQ